MSYEFSAEVGLKLLDAYPVRRNGQKVYVKPSELLLEEAMDIDSAINKVSFTFSPFFKLANRREMKMNYESSTAQDHEDFITNPAVQHGVRRNGKRVWVRWNELTPQEQAKERQEHHTQYDDVELLPEQQADADKTRAKREALQTAKDGAR